jgi:hypothetical protein
MALGDLSPDQARYVAQLVSATGLDRDVAAAWVGSESGWGVNKSDHNYLNIGPHFHYQSTDQAAGAAASLLRSSHLYSGIRSAISVSPAAQVAAIEASPWDAAHYGGSQHRLASLWRQLTGQGGGVNITGPNGVVNTGFDLPGLPGLPGLPLPGLGSLTKGIAGATGINKLAVQIVSAVGSALLSLVFAAGALALIGLGLARLTGNNARDLYDKAHLTKDQVQQAAQMAAVVA